MNLKSLLEGMAFGAIVAIGVTVWENHRDKTRVPPVTHISTPGAFAVLSAASGDPPKPIEEQLRHQEAIDAWDRQRDVDFKKCDAMRGTPVLGYNGRMICLDSRSVKLVGGPSPAFESSLK